MVRHNFMYDHNKHNCNDNLKLNYVSSSSTAVLVGLPRTLTDFDEATCVSSCAAVNETLADNLMLIITGRNT